MSRRARLRSAHDKRTTAYALAHDDFDLPPEDHQGEDEASDWWPEAPVDQRIPIGPLDLTHRESHA